MIKLTMKKLLYLQLRVISALVLREVRSTFGSSKLGYLWEILTPTAGVAILALIFSTMDRQPPFGDSLPLFFATGILTLNFFRKLSSSLMNTFQANKAFLSHVIIKEMDAIIARVILISMTYFIIMVLFYGILIILGSVTFPHNPVTMIIAFIATALFGFGFGLINSVLLSFWNSWGKVESILTRPLFFLSGIFFVPSDLPAEAINYLKWNPVLHLIELMRSGYYATYDSTILSYSYMIKFLAFLILFGMLGERIYRKQRINS